MVINAIQGVDAAVDGFVNGIEVAVRRLQSTADRDRLADDASAWESAREWQRYADKLEHANARMARELAELKREHLLRAERASNTQAFYGRYTIALTLRIRELDDLYQGASARLYANRYAFALMGMRGVKGLQPGRELSVEELVAQGAAHAEKFMESTDVRLGVPSFIESLKQ